MTTFLLATDSVHTTAAACDYLGDRAGADDTVVVLAVTDADTDDRDAGDALNVARTRLFEPTVETERRGGRPADEIPTVAADRDADEILVGPRSGDPDAEGTAELGETARAVLAAADRPVVVVPLADLSR